jgi:hypothetical protein
MQENCRASTIVKVGWLRKCASAPRAFFLGVCVWGGVHRGVRLASSTCLN